MYPITTASHTEHLEVGDGHSLYIQQSGNLEGVPVVYLHGGPGGGCSDWFRQFFDPDKYHLIMFDQRGAGKSTPHASLENNTTADLVSDIEKIREHLSIDKWMVFGGSWGSTLALAYAQVHAHRVTALVLRGIFLCRQQDIRWFYQEGASRVFPDYWQDFIAPIPEVDRGDLLSAYYHILTGDDHEKKLEAAKAWSVWEGRTVTLMPDPAYAANFAAPEFALAFARIESHYFYHQCFMQDNHLLNEIDKIRNIPGVIIHGRYDLVCPVAQAYELAQAWPEAELHIIDDAGHAASEPSIAAALIAATDQLADVLT